MNTALIVGLGGTGVLILRRLKAIASELWGDQQPAWKLLGFDLARSGTKDTRDPRFPLLDNDEFIWLASHEARAFLEEPLGRAEWLPPIKGLRFFDDVSPASAGNFRWLGRLSFQRAEKGIIRPNVQAALRHLTAKDGHNNSSPPTVILATSLAGGTGSGMLWDMSLLLTNFTEGADHLAYLALPQAGFEGLPRSWGNTYASLREVMHLRASPSSPAFQGEGSQGAIDHNAWERLYLYSTSESEDPPFFTTVERIAWAIAAPLHPVHRDEILKETEHVFHLVSSASPSEPMRHFLSTSAAFGIGQLSISNGVTLVTTTTSHPAEMVASLQMENVSLLQHIEEATSEASDLFGDILHEKLRSFLERSRQENKREASATNAELQRLARLVRIERSHGVAPSWWREAARASWRKLNVWRKDDILQDAPSYSVELNAKAIEELLQSSDFRGVKRRLQNIADSIATRHPTMISRLSNNLEVGPTDITPYPKDKQATNDAINWLRLSDEASKLFPRFKNILTIVLPPSLSELHQSIDERASSLLRIFGMAEFKEAMKNSLLYYATQEAQGRRFNSLKGGAFPSSDDSLDTKLRAPGLSTSAPLKGSATTPQELIKAVWSLRSNVFLPKPSNLQQVSSALILFPNLGMEAEDKENLKSLIGRTVQDALQCRYRIADHRGADLWIYYEDLFHAPLEIRHLDRFRDEYYRHPDEIEIFHLDYRLLRNPDFADLLEPPRKGIFYCGNPGCRENIADLPQTTILCPGCHRIIRSRCGNSGCPADDLLTHPEGRKKTCPVCHQFNHGAWWRCKHHGDVEALVAVDKERCPECILAHHADPEGFPISQISLRPDIRQSIACPRCIELHRVDPAHVVFLLPEDLVPFYLNGVNGVDREAFFAAIAKCPLVDDFRCPQCHTVLIPVGRPIPTPV
jgi:hypothetical protein